jgi:hypothetical protein
MHEIASPIFLTSPGLQFQYAITEIEMAYLETLREKKRRFVLEGGN